MDSSGAPQRWDPARYACFGRLFAEIATPMIDLLAPQPGERILDVGCGDGTLSERIAATGATVVAVDASADMVAAARDRGVDARVMDGQELRFEAEFDAVFSNAALHWMCRADAVVAGVRRALRPGGRLIAEFGGHGNISTVAEALYAALERHGGDGSQVAPWYFPTAEDYAAKLEAHGFRVNDISLFARPTRLPGELGDWLDNFAESFLGAAPAPERPTLKEEVTAELRPRLCDAAGCWTLDYVRLRVVARLEGAHKGE